MLQVRDIMTPGVFALDAIATKEEAAWALSRRHIGGAPVRDRDGNFIGLVSLSDLVNPEPAGWIHGEGTVEDLMSPVIYAVYAGDPALAAAELMRLRSVHRLLVLDEEGRAAGMVTATDVANAVAARHDFAIDAD
jgi:predicted transcriptional regulator